MSYRQFDPLKRTLKRRPRQPGFGIIAFMDYAIIATLGPSSKDEAAWQGLLSAGASAFRLNTSHLDLPGLEEWLEHLQAFFRARKQTVPLYLDLQGSKWRLGDFSPFHLPEGVLVTLVKASGGSEPGVLPVPHSDFFSAAPVSGDEILLNDGRLRLLRQATSPDRLQALVVEGGEVFPRKGITYQNSTYRQESLGEKDHAIVAATHHIPFIRYAISYIRDAGEMSRYRAFFEPQAYLAAKLERQPAVGEGVEMARYANELWLCRGDLGAELGLKGMAQAVKAFDPIPGQVPVPVMLAGQVLEHMTHYPHPTRSEVSYLYETLLKGYRGIVLSDETAIGHDPVQACRSAALFR